MDAMMAEDLQQFSAQATKPAHVSGSPKDGENSSGIKEVVDKVHITAWMISL